MSSKKLNPKLKAYVLLLRGINVGTSRRVEMKKLKALMESSGYLEVTTYINSGNVIFKSEKEQKSTYKNIEASLKKEFGFDIAILVKTHGEMKKIANAIPKEWQNDVTQKTDVAYLFTEVDAKHIIEELPVKKEFIEIRYIKGALIWNVKRVDYNKSQLNKLVSHPLYQRMTVRNVNTARYLAQ